MPDLIGLYELAQESGHRSVYVVQERCVPIQHRRSSCRRCIEGCLAEAIEIDGRKLKVDNALCVGCGVCATVCPTEAIISLDPVEADLRAAAASSVEVNGGVACVACARVAAREEMREDQYAEVPCLSRVNESVLVELVANGAKRVVLVDGGCKNCKYRDCDNVTQEVVKNANYLLERMGSELCVERLSAFPEAFEKKPQAEIGVARRAAFEDAGMTTKGLLGRAAKVMIRQEKSQSKASALVIDALGLDEEHEATPIAPQRQERLLDALFAIGEANGLSFGLPDEGFDEFDALGEEGFAMSEDGAPENDEIAPMNESPETAEPTSEDASLEKDVIAPSDALPEEGETALTNDGAVLDTRYFGMVEVDKLRCNKCGICAVVCKQGALTRTEEKMPDGTPAFMEFVPANCVQCQLCNEACFRKAITVTSVIALDALFSFDPMLIEV